MQSTSNQRLVIIVVCLFVMLLLFIFLFPGHGPWTLSTQDDPQGSFPTQRMRELLELDLKSIPHSLGILEGWGLGTGKETVQVQLIGEL